MPAEIEFECPHCEEVMTVSASKAGNKGRCRNCREWVRVPRSRGRVVQREVIAERRSGLGGCLKWAAISLSVLIIVGIVFSDLGKDSSDKEYLAESMAERFVRDKLKDGEGATFPGDKDSSKVSDGSWIVTGKVRAQNSFGAYSTSPYEVRLRHTGSNRWSVESVKVWE